MSGALFAIAVLVWLVAAYAFVRVAFAWLGVMRLASSGQKLAAAFELGFWNFPAVQNRLGQAAMPHIAAYRQGFMIFIGAVAAFMALVLVNIVTGNAA